MFALLALPKRGEVNEQREIRSHEHFLPFFFGEQGRQLSLSLAFCLPRILHAPTTTTTICRETLQMLCRDSWASHLYSSIPTNQQFIVASTNRFLVISAFVNCFLEIPQKSINRATNSIFFNPRRSHQEIFLFSQKIMSQVTQKCAHYAPGVQTKTFGFACSSSNHSTSKIVVSIRLIHSPHIHYSAF